MRPLRSGPIRKLSSSRFPVCILKPGDGAKRVLTRPKGAFTPGCSEKHLPGYIKNLNALKEKGVDVIAVIAYNDPHVMAAWGKANNIKGDDILFLSDTGNKFSQGIGWTNNEKLARYALVIDKGTITYAAKDNKGEIDVGFLFFSDF